MLRPAGTVLFLFLPRSYFLLRHDIFIFHVLTPTSLLIVKKNPSSNKTYLSGNPQQDYVYRF